MMPPYNYPNSPRQDQFDDYHGTRVADPYRWLENSDSPATQSWIQAQNQLTFGFLENIPARKRIREKLTELWDFPRQLPPEARGGRYFQLRNTGLQNQDVLFVSGNLDEPGDILLDPNTLSTDGTVALTGWALSRDGRYLAYATSVSGSDWLTWRIREVDSRTDLMEQIEWSKFSSVSWLPDGSGFFYSRYTEPQPGETFAGVNEFHKVYFHRLGTPQDQDRLIYERPDQKSWGFSAEVSEDGQYLILNVWLGTDRRNLLFYQDLQTGGKFVELINTIEAAYAFVGNDGPVFYLRTDLDAPRGRIIAVDTRTPAKSAWRTLVAETQDTLEHVQMVNNQFVALYLKNAYHQLRLFALDGTFAGEVGLPGIGSLYTPFGPDLSGRRGEHELFYIFQSFTHPPTIYRYDFAAQRSVLLFKPPLRFNADRYETRQLFATSPDGTKVPIFLTAQKGLELKNQNPTLLYGYGGFNVSETPTFQVGRLGWLELGGVFALAILRGGGEFGEEWHAAGMLHNKQKVFDDFIACAEHLIASGITRPEKLAIQGGSNGGLLVGACMTQRPELFGATLPAVGVMDMLRFHKFTIGWAWVSEYGSADDAGQFKTLLAYSPLHNLKPGVAYPATLVTTADHDDRVVPGHSFKFIAGLQAAQAGSAPVLIRIQTKAGHGFGKPTRVLIDETADLWTFLVAVLKMEIG